MPVCARPRYVLSAAWDLCLSYVAPEKQFVASVSFFRSISFAFVGPLHESLVAATTWDFDRFSWSLPLRRTLVAAATWDFDRLSLSLLLRGTLVASTLSGLRCLSSVGPSSPSVTWDLLVATALLWDFIRLRSTWSLWLLRLCGIYGRFSYMGLVIAPR